jgi:cytochrome P450 family 135
MPLTTSSMAIRLKGELPPSGPLPATLQTLGCRWLPFFYLEQCRTRLGDRFTVYPLDMPPLVFLSDPREIRAVLTAPASSLHPGAGATVIAPLIGERSFMLLEEDEHICGRRAITPAFHQRMVRTHTTMLEELVEREVAQWPLGEPLRLHPRIRSLTLNVILQAIFGDHCPELTTLHEQLMEMLTVTTSFLLQEPKLRRAPGWHLTWRRFVKRRAAVDKLIYELVRQRRAQGAGRSVDLLEMLLDAESADGSPMSERDIRDNLMSMILAGHETTTGELAWAFLLLAHNPAVQGRLAEEIDAGEEDAYLTATVHETMRHKPVFLFTIPREVVEPIEIGDWTYQPPVHLAGCTYLLHHDPEIFPRPQEFRPERFIDEAPTARNWLPWGGGRKHCLGRHFALLEVKAIIRAVLADRQVLAASDHIEHPRWRSAILVPHAGARVVLRER